ncbi:hypothetical protein CEXT_602341 [Caerostris extrusa]|uniref:Uncharacterized protein n=1 Tax=Caerostris extrusa TaxID=172846 RepID=A0AAV4SM51_CAEEX|nr:hypothetical protein CEXT_602341 [Caerostris extrusa]
MQIINISVLPPPTQDDRLLVWTKISDDVIISKDIHSGRLDKMVFTDFAIKLSVQGTVPNANDYARKEDLACISKYAGRYECMVRNLTELFLLSVDEIFEACLGRLLVWNKISDDVIISEDIHTGRLDKMVFTDFAIKLSGETLASPPSSSMERELEDITNGHGI